MSITKTEKISIPVLNDGDVTYEQIYFDINDEILTNKRVIAALNETLEELDNKIDNEVDTINKDITRLWENNKENYDELKKKTVNLIKCATFPIEATMYSDIIIPEDFIEEGQFHFLEIEMCLFNGDGDGYATKHLFCEIERPINTRSAIAHCSFSYKTEKYYYEFFIDLSFEKPISSNFYRLNNCLIKLIKYNYSDNELEYTVIDENTPFNTSFNIEEDYDIELNIHKMHTMTVVEN